MDKAKAREWSESIVVGGKERVGNSALGRGERRGEGVTEWGHEVTIGPTGMLYSGRDSASRLSEAVLGLRFTD